MRDSLAGRRGVVEERIPNSSGAVGSTAAPRTTSDSLRNRRGAAGSPSRGVGATSSIGSASAMKGTSHTGSVGGGGTGGSSDKESSFECNICFEESKDPVVTRCGHLFCWACLHEWLERSNKCPVCQGEATKETVIPLFARGSGSSEDPRSKNIPRPPRPERVEAAPQRRGNFFENLFGPFGEGYQDDGGGGGGMNIQFGFGFFPFGMMWAGGGGNNANLPPDEARQQQISRALLMMGMFILWCVLQSY